MQIILCFHTTSAFPHSQSLLCTFRGFQHRLDILHAFALHIWISCGCVHHLRRFYHVFMHHASMHFQIFDAIYTCSTKHLQNLCKSMFTYSITPSKLQAHRITSPNISLHEAHLLQIFSIIHTCHVDRLQDHQEPSDLPPFASSALQTWLVHITEDSYCARTHTGMHSGIYPLPTIQPLCFHLLKFSITFRSIVKHSYFWPPYSQLIGTYMSLIYSSFISFLFLSPFVFLSFTSYFLCVSCFRSLHFCSYLSHFFFRIFANICTLMYL